MRDSCDKFIAVKKLEYALRLLHIFDLKSEPQLLALALAQLTAKERLRLHSGVVVKNIEKDAAFSDELENSTDPVKRIRQRLASRYKGEILTNVDRYCDWMCSFVFERAPGRFADVKKFLQSALNRKLESKLAAVLKKPTVAQTRLNQLESVFHLNPVEAEVLIFYHIIESEETFHQAFSNGRLDMSEPTKSVRSYCRFFDISAKALQKALSAKGVLNAGGLISNRSSSRTIERIKITPFIHSYLAGLTDETLESAFFGKSNKADAQANLGLADFPIPEPNKKVFVEFLKSGLSANLLLYGKPGTGKTEFAKTIASEAGLQAFFLTQAAENGKEDLDFRKTALVAAQRIFTKSIGVLIVDECDPIVNTLNGLFDCEKKTDEKSWINAYLETSKLKIIWISNRVNGIDDSTKRRFSYNQEFKSPARKQRLRAWQIQVEKQKAKFLTETDVDQLSRKYTMSPGIMELSLRSTMGLAGKKETQATKLGRLSNILDQQQEFCVGERRSLADITSTYDLSHLNMNVAADKLIENTKMFLNLAGKTASASEFPNYNLLLAGPPGTGKTEFIKYLSDQVGCELLVKRASDLTSAYVGESEKNIAKAFSEAESTNAILFLDEADSLFINRANAFRSYEVSQTNELLTQMENFKGVLACATNLMENLDTAVMRRFAVKAQFDYMTPDSVVKAFNEAFTKLLGRALEPDEQVDVKSLKKVSLGDFKVVRQKFMFDKYASFSDLLAALNCELEIKSKHADRVMGI